MNLFLRLTICMKAFHSIALIITLFSLFSFQAQNLKEKKEVSMYRITEKLKIDGVLDEAVWKDKEVATDFIEFQPNNGKKESTQSPTLVKVLFDETSIYFGIELFESQMDSLNTRLSNRDSFGESEDWVLLALNPFNDQQQYFEFGVTAAGVQFDAFGTQSSGEDFSWNAIWDSAVKVEENRWVVEIQLPYSALRFPKEYDKSWSFNVVRNYSKNRKKLSWQHVDNEKGSFFQFNGNMVGIEGVTPPTRLFFIPYFSNYITRSGGETQNTTRGGMDLNWGINESFTLDAVLIPDFGQTDFDAVEYVLGPFEQQFSDKRPFFTEGTDLFSKGNLLYTRRVGEAPRFYPDISEDEEITDFPAETQLFNALKLSGRNKKGLGVGVLNAVTGKEEATIFNYNTEESRKATVSPLTNYNVLVLDQRLKESSSSISLINTSTLRNGDFRDANVSALIIDLYDKENKYNYYTTGKYSHIFDQEDKSGASFNAGIDKIFGKVRYGLGANLVTKDYDINDLGINFITNYYSIFLYQNYRILESNKLFNSMSYTNNFNARFDITTGKPHFINYNFNFNSTSKQKNNFNGFGFNFRLFQTYDFYEPRVEGRYSENPKSASFWYYNSPNYNKKFLIDKNIWAGWGSFQNMYWYGISLSPRYRPTDKLLLTLETDYSIDSHERGFVNQLGDDIIFGARNRKTITTNINGEYYFNPLTSLSLNFRHYYTNAAYQEFFNLLEDGSYEKNENYTQNHDFTFNTWNMDVRFSWWFAPGSQMEILYRNTLDSYSEFAENDFVDNLDFLFDQPITQIFSVRLTYFLDYNKAKTFIKGRKDRRNPSIKSHYFQNELRYKDLRNRHQQNIKNQF